jgi:hypothetical protein
MLAKGAGQGGTLHRSEIEHEGILGRLGKSDKAAAAQAGPVEQKIAPHPNFAVYAGPAG